MNDPYRVTEDIYVLPSHFSIPGVGVLPVNAFLLLGIEPVLVDTGLGRESEEFLEALGSVIDPGELRWIWLTHDDSDHTGSLRKVMELAPEAKLLTHALAALRMAAGWPLPLDRVHALTVGESINTGDRTLLATKPVLFDNPNSIGFYEAGSGTLFSVDAFGAFLPHESKDAAEFSEDELTQGIVGWEISDSPWVSLVDKDKFDKRLEGVRTLAPNLVLSTHLPPARDITGRLLDVLALLPEAPPFTEPNQAMFAQIAAALTDSSATRWRS
jgi:glyoxylase-like metal-dependent hydrolase (beta-lactamase superfamily II)